MAFILLPASLLLAGLLLIPLLFGDFAAYQLGLFLIYGIAAQGIGFLWGKTGVLPLGQALIFGAAAYLTAWILRDFDGLLLQLSLIVVSLIVISALAAILAAIIFRGRNDSGPYFSLITLALTMIAEQISGTASNVTGGFNGFSGFPELAGLDPFSNYYYLIVGAVVLTTTGLLILNRLPVSLLAAGVQDNEPRLQLLGFRTYLIKGLCFGFSAALAGLAGALFASHQGIVTPTSIGFAFSAELVILAAVGGRFHVFGPLIGAVLIGWLSAQLRDSFPYWEILLAVIFIVVVLKAPGGLAGFIARLWHGIVPWKPSGTDPVGTEAPARHLPASSVPLSFDDVHVHVGPVRILNGVVFESPPTGILSVIGPNGAGKTSILNTITGNLRVKTGAIRYGKPRIGNRPPYRALASGIGRKLQVPSTFASMTVRQNLAVATMAARARFGDYFRRGTLSWQSPAVAAVLGYPNMSLQSEMDKVAGTLPQGHKQFLEFAMTVAAEPALLLLDEPCAGLSHEETATMTELVRLYQMKRGGLVIVIEHDMSIVQAISDKVLVLHHGRVLAYGDYRDIQNDPAVQAVYAGDTK